jgi:hypothetical protein
VPPCCIGKRRQATGAFHSRITETRIATANTQNTSFFCLCMVDLVHVLVQAATWDPTPKLEPHYVIPAIHVNDFARDTGTAIGSQKHSSRTHLVHIHIAAQR